MQEFPLILSVRHLVCLQSPMAWRVSTTTNESVHCVQAEDLEALGLEIGIHRQEKKIVKRRGAVIEM